LLDDRCEGSVTADALANMSERIPRFHVLLVLAAVAASSACGDDADAVQPMQGGAGGNGGSSEPDAEAPADSGSGGNTSPWHSPDFECVPERHASDPCLACITTICCDELELISTVSGTGAFDYSGYDPDFTCTQSCFESGEDAGETDSLERLLACVPQCQRPSGQPLDFRDRDFLACVTGGPRPVSFVEFGQVTWREGEADEDAGIAPNCLAECLPGW
jgi:hypothetical protein